MLGPVIAASALTGALLYQQNLRLARLYPSLPVKAPVFPNEAPESTKAWAECYKGDVFVIDVPHPPAPWSSDDKAMSDFLEAFWNCVPLKIEARLLPYLYRLSIFPKFQRTATDPKSVFGKGDTVVNGGFIIESDRARHPAGPAIFRWGRLGSDANGGVSLGGYHFFEVQRSPKDGHVKLAFAGYVAGERSDKDRDTDRPLPGSLELLGEEQGWGMRAVWHFHILYARILMDCTARRLGLDVPWF